MFEVTRTFRVAAPAAPVVGYLTDWGNSAEWDPATLMCTRVDGGPVAIGSRWRNVVRLLGRDVVIMIRLDHVEDDRLVFTNWNRGATAVDTITVTALDAGQTSITYHSRVVLHRTARLVEPLMRRRLERLGDELAVQMSGVFERRVA